MNAKTHSQQAQSNLRSPILNGVPQALVAVLLTLPSFAQESYDHSDLSVVRSESGSLQDIGSVADWNRRRDHILLGMQEAMGTLPNPRPQPEFDVQITERLKGNGFERLTVKLVVEEHDRLSADLYLPMSRQTNEKRPAVLALHPTGALGKRIIAGAMPNRQYATELAGRGYVVLAPDYPSFGELKGYDFASDRYVSGTMKGIVNHMRCVDYLISRREVDPERIGVIGHSLGGHNALFVAAFDKRIKAVVTSCGWTPFHYYYGGNVKGWTSDRYMPLIRDKFELKPGRIPFDFYEVIASIAPRAVYSASPMDDANFSVAGVRDAEPKVRSVFERFASSKNFVVEYPQCAHDFPKATRSRTYAFLDKHLSFSPVSNTNFAAELPRIAPTAPAEAIKTFRVHPNFKLELAAHEPNVVDPVAACFDGYGRLYVVEMRGYSEDRDKRLGRVRRLEDRNGDGFFEHSIVFADGFKWPTGIAPFDGGFFVAAAPHIYYLKDGLAGRVADGRPDRAPDGDFPVVLTGLKASNVQGLVNSMRWGIDGRIHVATSSSGAELSRPGKAKTYQLRGRDFSFDPRIAREMAEAQREPRVLWGEVEWAELLEKQTEKNVNLGMEPTNARTAAEQKVADQKSIVAAIVRELKSPRLGRPEIRTESGGGQHGMCFDDGYNKFVCQNSNHIQHVLYEDQYAARASAVPAPPSRRSIAVDGPQAEVFRTSDVEPWRLVRTRLRVSGLVGGPIEGGGRAAGYFTGATGTTIFRGDAWPDEFRGHAFVGDVGSNIVHRKVLTRDADSFRANRARVGVEFISSTDSWFRPCQFLHGPDGNLYVLDMYRETIEHPKSLPSQIKRHLDLTSGRDRGRIYRVVSKNKDRSPRRRNPRAVHTHPISIPPAKLPRYLDSGNAWQRETVARLLFERQDKASVEPLRRVAREGTPLARLHALHLLAQVGFSLDDQTLLHALRDEDAVVRRHAVQLSERKLGRSRELAETVAVVAVDDDIQVRKQVAFSAFRLPRERAATIGAILLRDAGNERVRFAAVASSQGIAMEVVESLVANEPFRRSSSGTKAIAMLAELAVRENAAGRLLEVAEQLKQPEYPLKTALLQRAAKAANGEKRLQASLRRITQQQRGVLANSASSVSRRIAACAIVRLHPEEGEAVSQLAGVLMPTEPQALQLAAIRSMGELSTDQVATEVLRVYSSLTPTAQQAVVGILLTRTVWTETLLTAVAEQELPANTLSMAQLSALQHSRSSRVRELVSRLTAEMQSTPRSQVLAQWQDVLQLNGEATRGREVFRKNCAKCHRLEGVGEQIGPGLAAIRNRGIEAVLLNILDPNREVNPQYNGYSVVTVDGRTINGMIFGETASGITIRDGEKVNVTIPRDEIDDMRNTGLSLMPVGFEKQVSKQQMADLLRYLMTVSN